MSNSYRWSASWSLTELGESLAIHAGADLSFESEPLSAELRKVALAWAEDEGRFERPSARAEQELFDQLVILGAIRPLTIEEPNVVLRWIGDPVEELAERLPVGDSSATVLLIRTNATWQQTLDYLEANPLERYLFVDLAYHHTISLGPWAIVGETACAGCLAGRLRERWGDQTPPTVPAVIEGVDLIAALLRREIEQLLQGRPTLANATTTWDLSSGSSKRETLLRVPACPFCAEDPALRGKIELPWANEPTQA